VEITAQRGSESFAFSNISGKKGEGSVKMQIDFGQILNE
jgi:hypothetical protein